MACLVPGCKANYCVKDEYIPVFSFPADNETREKWFRAIPRQREDYEMNKRLRVCWIIHLITIIYCNFILFI